jgi:peptidyl-prolyl cis-trans isomerase A (cyclophilin A)
MRLIVLLAMLGVFVVGGFSEPGKKIVRVTIRTELGNIEVELYPDKAPVTVANFLRYLDNKSYTDSVFHRTVTMDNQPDKKVKIEVIQGGRDPKSKEKDFPPIKLERTNKSGIKHVDGAISMARDGADTATSDFFICIGAQPELDFAGKRNPDGQGFAAFGKVTKGMDVVRRIQKAPAKGQTLTPAIKILGIDRLPS